MCCSGMRLEAGMCMLEHCQAIDRRQVKHKMGHVYDERLQQKLCNGLAHHLQLMECIKGSDRYVSI